MERDVFSQPQVASVVEAGYVPVRVNADYFPTTCRQYGVTALPTDVIITPQGQQVDKFRGPLPAIQYVVRLDRAATAGRELAANAQAQPPTGPPPGPGGGVYRPGNTIAYQAPDAGGPPDPRYADYSARPREPAPAPAYVADRGQPAMEPRGEQSLRPAGPTTPPPQAAPWQETAGPALAGPVLQPPTGGRLAGNPPLGLDGYCPVQLSDDMKANLYRWTLGDRRWGAIHRGRTYLFAGPEQQRRFLADPDRYAPVLSGNDVVIAVEQGQGVSGRREHGLLFGNQVYLFADEASLEKFSQNPQHYARQVFQGTGSEARRRQQAYR
jgi:protein disulfide-isomerase